MRATPEPPKKRLVAPRLKVGDVFAIPVAENLWGVGQVVQPVRQGWFWAAAFWQLVPEGDEAQALEVARGPLALLAQIDNVHFAFKVWRRVGHAPVRPDLPYPAWKCWAEDHGWYFTNFDMTAWRKPGPEERAELDRLPYPTMSNSGALTEALRDLHGLPAMYPVRQHMLLTKHTTQRYFPEPPPDASTP